MIARLRPVSRIALVALLPLAMGCGPLGLGGSEPPAALTSALIDEYKLKDDDFKQLQYYLADDLVLTRKLQHEDSKERVKGKLVERHGDIDEEVTVRKGTPGVCVGSGKDGSDLWLEISFEEGSSLKFDHGSSSDPFTVKCKSGEDGVDVDFAGNTYHTTLKEATAAILQVGQESLNNAEKRQRSLPGRKLDDPPPAGTDKH